MYSNIQVFFLFHFIFCVFKNLSFFQEDFLYLNIQVIKMKNGDAHPTPLMKRIRRKSQKTCEIEDKSPPIPFMARDHISTARRPEWSAREPQNKPPNIIPVRDILCQTLQTEHIAFCYIDPLVHVHETM